MNALKLHPNPAMTLRWVARIASIASIWILGLFLFGEPPTPRNTTAVEWLGLAFFPFGVVVGMVISWKNELFGAVVGLASLACFYLLYGMLFSGRAPAGIWFAVFSSPLVLYLFAGLATRSNVRSDS